MKEFFLCMKTFKFEPQAPQPAAGFSYDSSKERKKEEVQQGGRIFLEIFAMKI